MQISGKGPSVNLEAYVNHINQHKKKGVTSPQNLNGAIKKDQVVLSPKAMEIQTATKQLDSLPDIRCKKVTELKNQIEEGSYSRLASHIASEMIKESLSNDFL